MSSDAPAACPIPDPTTNLHWDNYGGAIHEIFADNAQTFPDRECVVETQSAHSPQRIFTYRQINESSNQLAHYLVAHGCRVNDVVMIYGYRGVDLVVAYMGALKAGATVSVLDPQYPAERQTVLLDVAKPKFLILIAKANKQYGEPADLVMDFVAKKLTVKSTLPALELRSDGTLVGGRVGDKDCLDEQVGLGERRPNVLVGPDCHPTLSFTSGSEGRPKGVLGRHFSLTYYVPWMAATFGLSASDRFTMLSGIAHDPIQRDMFTPFLLGAQLLVPPADVITYELLAEWMKDHGATVTHLTPAMGQILVGGAMTHIPSLRNAFFVGDVLTKKDTRKLRDLAPNASVINLYGTTETQRAVSYFAVPSKARDASFLDRLPDVIPVGQGMVDVQLLVVDRDDKTKLCGIGQQGELFMRAGGLAEGYVGDDDETAELNRTKFLANWFVNHAPAVTADASREAWRVLYKGPRDRIYRTGDLGCMRVDGSIECTGRVDNQVKIRGFRIELGEIDTVLSQHPFVRENVTVVRRDKDEEPRLVTYFVPETKRWLHHLARDRSGRPADSDSVDESMAGMLRRFRSLADDCRNFLATKLPKHAVPGIVVPLARMVLNPNGKIDRRQLPFPDQADLAILARRRSSSVAPHMTDTQKRLARVWASVLPNRTARMFVPTSNFYDEGGHSVLAQLMLFRLKKAWNGIDLPVSAVFRSQTLEALAAEIDRAQDPIGLRLDALPLPSDSDVDEAYAADARDLVYALPASMDAAPATFDRSVGPIVFLTGATGFVGAYVLHELLEGPSSSHVIALVRAADPAAGLARIERIARAYGLWHSSWTSDNRLEVVGGDIAEPQLGLAQTAWDCLADSVDVVVHNGAQVNWMLPYSRLRSANVLSTLACVMLCACKKPKRMVFVSSTSTLDSAHFMREAAQPVLETDDLAGSAKGLATGYGQTKWASEFIVREAGRRGLSGAVVRPGYITGDPVSGASVTDDFLVRLWKGCLQVGTRPDIANTLNAVPVTQVSRIVVAAALTMPACLPSAGEHRAREGGVAVAQVTGHPRLTLNEWTGALEVYGYPAPLVPYRAWADQVASYITDAPPVKEEHALLPLFHFVTGDLPADSVAPEMDDVQAATALRAYSGGLDDYQVKRDEDPLAANKIDIDTLGVYMAYLVAVGYLPAPSVTGAASVRALPKLKDAEKLKTLVNEGIAAFGGRSAARA